MTATIVAGTHVTTCRVLDISGGGARCLVYRGTIMPVGERVQVTLDCSVAMQSVTVAAQVLRTEQLDATNDIIALTFVSLDDPIRDTILQIVLRALARHRATVHESVLVVDDEEAIRTALAREMKRLGRPVLCAATSLEAVRMLRDETNGIAVALVDLGLGDSDGLDVIAHVAAEHAGVRRVVMSGERIEDLELAVGDGRAHGLLRKPWSRVTLEGALGIVRPA